VADEGGDASATASTLAVEYDYCRWPNLLPTKILRKMKKRILVTGFSGVGKSTVTAELKKLGHTAYDLDQVEGLFTGIHQVTGEVMEQWDNLDPDTGKNLRWMCDKEKLRKLIAGEPADVAFYCGSASNIFDLLELFDQTIVLIASHDTIRHRLTTRTSNDYGRTKEVQDHILKRKDEGDQKLVECGAIAIDTHQPVERVVSEILRVTSG
jgi:broad-specificity NMP kinase